ncbi:MAG: hypothetical protein ABSD28_01800 [Tepidisphaeraceae bacterium]|jgi:hypothetical protein
MGMVYRVALIGLALTLASYLAPLRADDTDSSVTVKSQDGQVHVVLPNGWLAEKSSNPGAAIEARNDDSDAFVMVLIANRDDPYLALDDYSTTCRDEVLSHLVKSKCSDPQPIEVNGYKAIQYEIHGTSPASKVQFGYFVTIVQMRRHYLEVVAWSVEKYFPDNAPVLKPMPNSVTFTGDQ